MNRKSILILIIFLGLITIPFIVAAGYGGESKVFNGFLINPTDGYSYLAKIQEGASGKWLFNLPFTHLTSISSFLFEYYIFLGHLSRWLGISNLWIFHLARVINAMLFAIVLIWFIQQYFHNKSISSKWVLAICLFGSGMGWLVTFSGIVTMDLWVAEAYPFLASFANPHFPLSIAVMLGMFIVWEKDKHWQAYLITAVLGVLLAILQPFCNIIVGLVLGVDWIFELFQHEPWKRKATVLAIFGLSSLPIAVIYLNNIASDPLLAQWNKQNITPSPAIWDLLISFSPAIIFALIGFWKQKNNREKSHRLLWIWAVLSLGICFIPISLQRRFLIGVYIPLSILAVEGIQAIFKNANIQRRVRWTAIYTALVIPTNLILIVIFCFGIIGQKPDYFLSKDEVKAFDWLKVHGKPDGLVLSDSQTGLYIPATTGLRVIYGHPYETPNAAIQKMLVDECLIQWNKDCSQLISGNNIYLLIGTQPGQVLPNTIATKLEFSSGPVEVYAVQN
jgi:hypothetical protein